ncbi:MAG: DNA primase [Eggerthellaceae bacterium]|nr:DNA primase [Eggerthellaceae bacterium]
MAGISEEDIQKIREANDVVSVIGDRVPVRQQGRDFWCCCPIHEDKNPSCKIDPATQLWHCFGCGAGGDVFSFIMQADGLSFPDAAYKLAERANITIVETGKAPGPPKEHKARLVEACKETAAFYHLQLMRNTTPQAQAARSYLAGRGFGGEVPKKWRLGFAPGNGALISHLRKLGFKDSEMVDADVAYQGNGRLTDRFYNRVMFPIADVQGEVIAFGGRIIEAGDRKYLNTKETPIFHKSEVLFGLDKAKAAMAATGTAIVVEGYTDVITLHEAGITNAVATLGTALTKQHIRILSRHAKDRIVYLFDGDTAGQKAAERALGFIDESITPEAGPSKVEILAVILPDDLDPADFVTQRGADALRDLLGQACPLIAFGIEHRLARFDMKSAESRSRAADEALSILAPIKGSLLAKDYAVQIAARTRMKEADVLARLAGLSVRVPASEAHEGAAQPLEPEPEHAVRLPQAELNRRRFEREFLGLIARNPHIALAFADTLAQTQWHEPVHAAIAESLLESLSSNPGAQAAELVSAAAAKVPAAAGILTSGVTEPAQDLQALAAFLAEELWIGDTEDSVALLKAQLADTRSLEAKDQELLFESVVALQKSLSQRRAGHARP